MTLRILFVSANPVDTAELQTSEEYKDIRETIRGSKHRSRIDLVPVPAANFGDFRQALQDYEPAIVHFSGHGTAAHAINFVGEDGKAHEIPPDVIAQLLREHRETVRVVVLNACYADGQARAIAKEVDCAVGMVGQIADPAAIEFSKAFYEGIGGGKSVRFAFNVAKVSLGALSRRADHVPRVEVREDTDLDTLFLLEDTTGASRQSVDPDTVHVDRDEQIEIFKEMITGQGEVNVLVVTAPSGMGKTRLIDEFETMVNAHDGARIARIRLDAAVDSPIDMLGRLAAMLDKGESFPTFNQLFAEFARSGSPSAEIEKMQLQLMTRAFIDDLSTAAAAATAPTVLMFDAYNKSGGVLETWLADLFLASVAHRRSINVIVAGQTEPGLSGRSTTTTQIGHLEPKHIREWARLLGIEIQEEETIQWLYRASLKGHPDLLKREFRRYLKSGDDNG